MSPCRLAKAMSSKNHHNLKSKWKYGKLISSKFWMDRVLRLDAESCWNVYGILKKKVLLRCFITWSKTVSRYTLLLLQLKFSLLFYKNIVLIRHVLPNHNRRWMMISYTFMCLTPVYNGSRRFDRSTLFSCKDWIREYPVYRLLLPSFKSCLIIREKDFARIFIWRD